MPYILTRDMSFLAFGLYKALHLFFLWFSCDSPGAWPSDWLQSWERWRSTQARPSCQQALSASQSWGYDNEKVTNYKASFGKWTCWYLMGSTASLTCYWAGVLLLIRELVTGSGGHVPAEGVIQRSGWEELNDAAKEMTLLCSCPVHR